LFDLLNDLWTPDVKANQLADIISSIGPIRSIVNVGSGVADLVLLPIAQYKKDKRLVRGVQKGTTSFLKTTAMEAIQIGARLATGTQVILEHAEHVLGGDFKDTMTLEARSPPSPSYMASRGPGASDNHDSDEGSDSGDPISKYAEQPVNVMEGIHSASRSIRRNLNSAAQTILAVPMEVYENSGNEVSRMYKISKGLADIRICSQGAMRSVIRAVPIAVLRPMIGASEALSKTLFGLSNTLDPSIRRQNEDKYKQR
jgi:autophagy-related protein 2